MDIIVNHLGGLASLVGSLTVVGSALIWIYNKFIGSPREKKREQDETKRQKEMIKMITKENIPLNKSIENLNELLEQSKTDRENLNRIAKTNTEKIEKNTILLNKHDDQIIKLSIKNGLDYKGGE